LSSKFTLFTPSKTIFIIYINIKKLKNINKKKLLPY
jgi:hypothetical protein